jgi:hypothetical protein
VFMGNGIPVKLLGLGLAVLESGCSMVLLGN